MTCSRRKRSTAATDWAPQGGKLPGWPRDGAKAGANGTTQSASGCLPPLPWRRRVWHCQLEDFNFGPPSSAPPSSRGSPAGRAKARRCSRTRAMTSRSSGVGPGSQHRLQRPPEVVSINAMTHPRRRRARRMSACLSGMQYEMAAAMSSIYDVLLQTPRSTDTQDANGVLCA